MRLLFRISTIGLVVFYFTKHLLRLNSSFSIWKLLKQFSECADRILRVGILSKIFCTRQQIHGMPFGDLFLRYSPLPQQPQKKLLKTFNPNFYSKLKMLFKTVLRGLTSPIWFWKKITKHSELKACSIK